MGSSIPKAVPKCWAGSLVRVCRQKEGTISMGQHVVLANELAVFTQLTVAALPPQAA